MITGEQVLESLKTVIVPDVMRSTVDMNLIRNISISDRKVTIQMAASAINSGYQRHLKNQIEKLIGRMDNIESVIVNFEAVKPQEINSIGHVIAIMSGKGGVGKSLVSGLTAIALTRRGCSVGILDADITGPSIPKMFGVHTRPSCSDNGILPVSSKTGIEMMSLNLLLSDENEAVIWRGPIIGNVITQFWEEVLWGQLDYLIVDLPPGTADAPLTVLQRLPVSGIIIVSSPQDLAAMIVKKAVNMAKTLKKPIMGVIENMSYLYLPDTGQKIEIFGQSKGEEIARVAGAPLLAQIPVDPELARLCDAGQIELYQSEMVHKLGESICSVPLSCAVGTQDYKSCSHKCKSSNPT